MTNSKFVQITKDQNGREAVMVRVDKTAKEWMEAKPYSRWDPDYWHPIYDDLFRELNISILDSKSVGSLMLDKTDGITYGQVGKRVYDEHGEVHYLQVSNIKTTGIDLYAKYAKIAINSYNDPKRSRLKENDVLLINGGMGSLGRCCVFVNKKGVFNISQDIDRIRLVDPNLAFYVAVFFNSKYGQMQIERFTKGVSGQTKVGFEHVRTIVIPSLASQVANNIKSEYKKMSVFHDKAMEGKKKSDETTYKMNMEVAEKMLKDLIARTEAVIRGERKDVI